MVNKEIFVMITFFVSIVSMLGLIIASGITTTGVQTVSINQSPNYLVSQSNQQLSCNTNSTINSGATLPQNQTSITGLINSNPLLGFAFSIINPFTWGLTALLNAVQGQIGTATNNPTLICGALSAQQQQAQSFGGFIPITISPLKGQNLSGNNIGALVTQTLIVAGIFVGLGLLAGTLGAGQLAPVVSSVGIGMSLIFFMQSILSSTYFNGTPFILQIFLTGITGVFFIWIVITLLRD